MAVPNNDSPTDLALKNIIDHSIRQLDQQKLCNFNPSDEGSEAIITSLANLCAELYDNLFKSPDFLLNEGIPDLRQLNGTLAERFENWTAKRRELIRALISTAQELDERFRMVTRCRLIGSSLDLLYNVDSVYDNTISCMITNQAFGISRSLGVASLIFFRCLPHFAYMGLVSAFVDSSISKTNMKNILKVNGEDSRLLEKIEESIKAAVDMDSSMKQNFPNEFKLDDDIAWKIEEVLSNYEENLKIFTTVVLSNVRGNANLAQVILAIFKFIQTDVARELYSRSVKRVQSIGMELTRLEYRNQLLQLSYAAPEIPLEIVKLAPEIQVNKKDTKAVEKELINLKLKYVPHFLLGALNCYYIYTSYRDLRNGTKQQHSELLRDMADKAGQHMEEVITFMSHYAASRQLSDGTDS